MANLQSFQSLKLAVDAKRGARERAKGAYNTHITSLKTNFGVADLNGAKELLATLRADEAKQQAAYDKAVIKFKAANPDV